MIDQIFELIFMVGALVWFVVAKTTEQENALLRLLCVIALVKVVFILEALSDFLRASGQ